MNIRKFLFYGKCLEMGLLKATLQLQGISAETFEKQNGKTFFVRELHMTKFGNLRVTLELYPVRYPDAGTDFYLNERSQEVRLLNPYNSDEC